MCTRDEEWCDGLDNDCDGAIDESHSCPDSTVRHTLPSTLGLWLWTTSAGREPLSSLRPLLGERLGDPIPESARGTWSLKPFFRVSDEALFYRQGMVTYEHVPGGTDAELPTPPCFGSAWVAGFDAENRLYYQCRDTIRRGNGEIIASSFQHRVLAVLASGRMLASETQAGGRERPYLMETDGTELSTPPSTDGSDR